MSTSEDGRVNLPSLSIPADPFQKEQTMLILVGLIASGKSTFAEALEGYFPKFRRCNQDELGNRQRVEELAYHTLREGGSPCIDRTNFNAIQRLYWSPIARAFPGTSISIIVLHTPYDVCASRLQRRTAHPTIRDAQHGVAVLQKFASDFQMPSPGEGYDHIIYLRPEDHPRPEYTRLAILSILERLKASTRHSGINVTQPGHSRMSTHQARGYRGGDEYQGFLPVSARGTLYGSLRFKGRVRGSNNPNWRRPGPGVTTNQEISNQRSTVAANVPSMESSKGRGSAEERHNSS